MNPYSAQLVCRERISSNLYKYAAPWSAATAKRVSRLFDEARAPAAAEKNYHAMIKEHLGLEEPSWFAVPREKKVRDMMAKGGYQDAQADEAVRAYRDMGFDLKKDQVVGPDTGDAGGIVRRLGLTDEKFTPQQNNMLRATMEGHELDELRGARADRALLSAGHRNLGVVMREGNRMRRLNQAGGQAPVTRTMEALRNRDQSSAIIEGATGGRVGYTSGPRPSRHAIKRISQLAEQREPAAGPLG